MSNPPLPDVLTLVKAFVEGTDHVEVFTNHLYTNGDLEQFLRSAAPIPPFSTSNAHNLFQYLIELNFKSEYDVCNARDALSRLLTNEGIPHVKSEVLATRATLLMQAQPKWLDLNPDEFRHFLKDAGHRQGQGLRDWMKAELLQHFKGQSTVPGPFKPSSGDRTSSIYSPVDTASLPRA